MRDLNRLREQVGVWQTIGRALSDARELAELGDEEMRDELSAEVERLSAEVAALEFQTLMSGDYDDESAILAIHAGAGGTEAQDWAQMLQRMFLRWAEQHRLSADILDESAGDEAGIKSCTIAIRGRYAYGWLKSERGVHRLVRISPFDGLIDSEEGDLPDWLREAPPVSADSPLTSDGEFESRLDWLAKMAERESIEELPTLEWRHLADAPAPVDQVGGEAMATDLDTLPPFAAEEMPVEATPVEPLRAEAVVHLPPPAGEPEEQPDYQAEVDAAMPALLEEATEVEEALPDLAATDLAATDLAATDLAANAPITAEALLDTLPPCLLYTSRCV